MQIAVPNPSDPLPSPFAFPGFQNAFRPQTVHSRSNIFINLPKRALINYARCRIFTDPDPARTNLLISIWGR